jgi:hypothetical protein
MMWLAAQRGCSCEICGAGTWIKFAQTKQELPDYLVLYHRDGHKENKNINNLALRCTYCAEHSNILPESFRHPRKTIDRSHGHAGSAWYNNGLMSKFIKPAEFEIFERMGWKRGRMVPRDKFPPNHRGKTRITNGVINKWISSDQPIPDGWWHGKLNYSKLESPEYNKARRGKRYKTRLGRRVR